MIDRFGKHIVVAWLPEQILWLMATNTLPRTERCAAYHDIAEMRGCTFARVAAQAHRFKVLDDEKARKARLAAEGYPRAITPAAPIPRSTLNTSPRMLAMRTGARA